MIGEITLDQSLWEQGTMSLVLRVDEELISDSKKLLDYAKSSPDDLAPLMYSASIIFMISALEAGTKTFYQNFAEKQACLKNINIKYTKAYQMMSQSLRYRVRTLPEFFSEGEVRLNSFHHDIKIIDAMISLRNNLVHYSNVSLVTKVIDANKKGINITLSEDGSHFTITAKAPKLFGWVSVTNEQAEQCYTAAKRYVVEVIGPAIDDNFDDFKESELIIP